ncbi:MAG: tRNA (adenosine(37)-N6)-dimethylallyltransferase MiaA [Deltaproteobacteria bacterium]|nr:tRNA (adenosine(37)-N6)-dimethylallyltransferase MiaA [Deltaproteobacteria bacterium]
MNDIFAEPLIFLAGPTAIGKTEIALHIAERFNCEIIGVDSMQIYQYMDIGTAKPGRAERARVRHHLIDYIKPDGQYNAARFVRDCRRAISEIRGRGRVPLLTGGTGLYFTALQDGIFSMPEIEQSVRADIQSRLAADGGCRQLYEELKQSDPESAARIHANDTYRITRALEIYRTTGKTWASFIAAHRNRQAAAPRKRILKIALTRARDELYQRINQRVGIMIEQGLLAEVEGLLAMGFTAALKSMQSLGYRHMVNFINHTWSWQEALELLARDTRRYAKRQLTWFKADKEIIWLPPDKQDEIFTMVDDFLNNTEQLAGRNIEV